MGLFDRSWEKTKDPVTGETVWVRDWGNTKEVMRSDGSTFQETRMWTGTWRGDWRVPEGKEIRTDR
jgi:hypothetical protein